MSLVCCSRESNAWLLNYRSRKVQQYLVNGQRKPMGDISTCAVVKSSAARLRDVCCWKGYVRNACLDVFAGYLSYELKGWYVTSLRSWKLLKIQVFVNARKSQDIEPKVKRTDATLNGAKQRFTDCWASRYLRLTQSMPFGQRSSQVKTLVKKVKFLHLRVMYPKMLCTRKLATNLAYLAKLNFYFN